MPTTRIRFRALQCLTTFCLIIFPLAGNAQDTPESAIEAATPQNGDVLKVRVWPDSSLSGEFPVEETGLVYLPLIGEYRVAGRSVASIRQELRALYGRELKSPVVTVTPVFRVSVLGAVQRPGMYYVDATRTWFDVISEAGGFQSNAARDQVRVIRGPTTLNVNAAEGNQSALGVSVQSGDRIIVQERPLRPWMPILSVIQTVVIIATAINQFK